MTVRQLNGQSLALGLSWLPPGRITAARGESRRTRELLKLRPQPTCFTEIELPWTTQIAVTADSDAVGHASAAAWLASAQQSAVLVERIADNEFWLCVVEDGVVFPAGDIVGDHDRISARIAELKADLASSRISYYDRHGRFELPDPLPLEFSDLTSGTEPQDAWTVRSIRQPRTGKPWIPLAVVATAVAVGYGAWHWYTLSLESQPAVEVTAAERRQRLLEHEKTMLAQTLSQNSAQLVTALADEISTRPHRAAGWRNTAVEWEHDIVKTRWHRAHGSYSALAAHLGDRQFSLDAKTGVVTEEFQFSAPDNGSLDIDQALSAATDRYALLDALASLPGTWTLSESSRFGTEYSVNQSALTGTAPGFAAAEAVARFFSTSPVHIRSISIKLETRPLWRFEGDFYELSAD